MNGPESVTVLGLIAVLAWRTIHARAELRRLRDLADTANTVKVDRNGFGTWHALVGDFAPAIVLGAQHDLRVSVAVWRTTAPEPLTVGREILEQRRGHETIYRLEADLFATLLLTRDRAAGVEAAARLAGHVTPREGARAGIVSCPDQAVDAFDAVGRALQRLAPLDRFEGVAREVRAGREAMAARPAPTAQD